MSINVLIVDDSATVRAVIAKCLKLAQVPLNELHQAENGEEALKVLKAQPIDLVFSDINMPVMGGVEMINLMRQDEELLLTPVIVVSTESSETRIAELNKTGIQGFIHKPFTPESLRNAVDETMGTLNEN